MCTGGELWKGNLTAMNKNLQEVVQRAAVIVGLEAVDQRHSIKRRKQLASLQAALLDEIKREEGND